MYTGTLYDLYYGNAYYNVINCLFVYRLCCSSNTVNCFTYRVRYLAQNIVSQKTVYPTTILTFFWLKLETLKFEIRPLADKLERLKSEIKALKNKRTATLRQLQS